jgi:hypothetical protein
MEIEAGRLSLHTSRMRRRQRLLSWLAFGLLALVAELAGRSLTARIDIGRHVAPPSYANADYYPALLASVKVGIALLLARLAWRIARARAIERAGSRILATRGRRPAREAPRVRLHLSPRLWLGSFALTSLIYLVQSDAEGATEGRWRLLAPWLHSSALPVFAVLAVAVAVVWRAAARWLADYEEYAAATLAEARGGAVARSASTRRPAPAGPLAPRELFGLAFESRPPPPLAA